MLNLYASAGPPGVALARTAASSSASRHLRAWLGLPKPSLFNHQSQSPLPRYLTSPGL